MMANVNVKRRIERSRSEFIFVSHIETVVQISGRVQGFSFNGNFPSIVLQC